MAGHVNKHGTRRSAGLAHAVDHHVQVAISPELIRRTLGPTCALALDDIKGGEGAIPLGVTQWRRL